MTWHAWMNSLLAVSEVEKYQRQVKLLIVSDPTWQTECGREPTRFCEWHSQLIILVVPIYISSLFYQLFTGTVWSFRTFSSPTVFGNCLFKSQSWAVIMHGFLSVNFDFLQRACCVLIQINSVLSTGCVALRNFFQKVSNPSAKRKTEKHHWAVCKCLPWRVFTGTRLRTSSVDMSTDPK